MSLAHQICQLYNFYTYPTNKQFYLHDIHKQYAQIDDNQYPQMFAKLQLPKIDHPYLMH